MDNDWKNKGVLRKFDVNPYLDTSLLEKDGLDDEAYIYYPYSCINPDRKTKCKIHFALHSCSGQMNGLVPWDFIRRYGYNDYAATNDLIIVYPQVRATVDSF